MNCPICKQEMKEVRQSVTNNKQTGPDYKEYSSTTYQCEADDTWVNVELPVAQNDRSVHQ